MTSQASVETTSDERVMAVVAHLLGTFGALIVWALQKDKSRFVRFQAIQALAFGVLTSLLIMLLMVGLFVAGFGAAALSLLGAGTSDSVPTGLVLGITAPFLAMACLMPFSLVLMLVHLYAAFSVGSGRDFRYPWLGKQVEKFLGADAPPAPSTAPS